MTMKKWNVVVGIMLLIAVIAYAQQSQKTPTAASSGRFALIHTKVPTQVPNGREAGVFVIDTQTGRVWKYDPTRVGRDLTNGGMIQSGEHFYLVPFSGKVFLGEGQIEHP